MDLSIFLAKLIGLYMLIVALVAILRKKSFLQAVTSIVVSESVFSFSGVIALVLGLAILIGHPIAELNWRGLITFIGALAVIQGILRLGFTAEIQKIFTAADIERMYPFMLFILIAGGSYLTYHGFTQLPY